jgi:uncharacterized protein YndB with AHSA1/START domain
MAATNSEQTKRVGKLTVTIKPDRAEFERVFDVPRRLVWEAMSKPEHYPHWWGVASDEMISCELDFRAGGSYRFVTRGAEGVENAFRGEIREVVPRERLVQTFEYEGMPGNIMLDSLTLAEQDGKTLLRVTSIFVAGSPEAFDAMMEAGMAEGAAETYDRLEAYARTLA